MKLPSGSLIVFIAGVVACVYVAFVGLVGALAVFQDVFWHRFGRALWVAMSALLMASPGVVAIWLSVRFLRRERQRAEERPGFSVVSRE